MNAFGEALKKRGRAPDRREAGSVAELPGCRSRSLWEKDDVAP